jgi:hypothetical protein
MLYSKTNESYNLGVNIMTDKINIDSKASVFDKTYKDYLKQLGELDLSQCAQKLGLTISGNELLISLFNSEYRVSSKGVISPLKKQAEFEESIIIFKYILTCPEVVPENSEWAAYHSFKDAQPLLHYFARETTGPIEKIFSGNLTALEEAGKKLGGIIVTDNASYDLSMQFEALSKIPVFLRFNDKDEDFPAQCTVLFKFSVEKYLDMESLGILGTIFAKNLIENAK